MATHTISIPLVGPEVESLLLWRNLRKSGIVFGSITAAYALLGLYATSGPLPLLLKATALVSLISLIWATGAGFFGRAGPPVPPVLEQGFSEDSWTKLSSSVRPHVNVALSFLGVLASGKQPKLSIVVCVAAYIAAVVLAAIPLLTLAYLVVLLAFTVPKLYELKKDDADKYIGIAQDKFNEVYTKLDDAVFKKIKPTPKKEQ